MTFRTTINSKSKPKDFLQRGFKSMFSDYDAPKPATIPVDSDQDKNDKQPTR